MSSHLQFGVLFLTAASLVAVTDRMALATPDQSYGMSCTVCHTTKRDALDVNGDLEALPTFTVEAGETVQLSFEVYEEAGVYNEFEYILGVRGLDAPGFNPSLGSDWEYRSGEAFSYVLNDEQEDSRTFTFEVTVDLSLPANLYRMEAIVAGHDEFEDVNINKNKNEDEDKDEKHSNWIADFGGPFLSEESAPWYSSISLVSADNPEWTLDSTELASSELSSSSQAGIMWSDLQPFYLRVTSSSAVPEPSTIVLLLTLAVGLSLKRIPLGRRSFQHVKD